MNDLIARLIAAIDEDESVAQASSAGPWSLNSDNYPETIYGAEDGTCVVAGGRWGGEASVFDSDRDAAHIVRWHPARVLRACASDRKLLAAHSTDVIAGQYWCNTCHVPGDAPGSTWCETVLATAERYDVQP